MNLVNDCGDRKLYLRNYIGRCSQHCGGASEQAKGADGMQLCVVDCIAYVEDAERDECLLV